ncbi:MAG: hypothetical protein JWM80_5036 [Cyanobacteria bacterium RYN_339]|nr:hypothetical protein [Cyanobacteria bacterium RYN_339]
MDELTFPSQLVDHLISAWANLAVEGAMPPRLPGRAQLRRLLEVAYVASLETEEGRPTTFTLCCVHSNHEQPEGGDVEWWPFCEARAFEVQELRRLAAATSNEAAAIWVQWEEMETAAPRIFGILNIGAAGAGVLPGFATRSEAVPGSLMLRIEGPGRLTVYHRDRAMMSLAGGRLHREEASTAQLLEGHPLLLEARRYFDARLQAAGAPVDHTDGLRLDSAFRTLLVIILAGIQRIGSGGTLVLVSPDSAAQSFLKPKYALKPGVAFLAANYTAMLLARANLDAMIGPGRRARDLRDNLPDDLQRFYLLRLEVRTARQRLLDEAEFLARLSGADGATVMTSTLMPAGFGVEIAYGPVTLPPVYDVKEGRALDVEEFGMRHRSAIRLVAAAPDVVAFVVSKDGSVNMIFGQDGRVTFHRDVPLVRGVV